MPNPRRGREEVQFLDETANATIVVSAAAFAARFDDSNSEQGDVSKGKSLQSKRWRRGCRFDPNRAGFHCARARRRTRYPSARSCSSRARRGARRSWGGPLPSGRRGTRTRRRRSRPPERAADEAARRSVTVSDTGDGVTVSDTGGPAIEPEPRDAAIAENALENALDDGSAPTERRDLADDEAGLGSDTTDEDAAGAAEERFTKTTDWVTVSVLAYSDASGEHQVLYPDGKREWLALVMQETRGRVTARLYVFLSFCLFVAIDVLDYFRIRRYVPCTYASPPSPFASVSLANLRGNSSRIFRTASPDAPLPASVCMSSGRLMSGNGSFG